VGFPWVGSTDPLIGEPPRSAAFRAIPSGPRVLKPGSGAADHQAVRSLIESPLRSSIRRAAGRLSPWLAAAAVLLLFAAPAHARIIAADDQITCVMKGGDVGAFMRAHRATVLRIIVPYWGGYQASTCGRKASAQGYRVYVSLQYNNAWRPAEVAAYFRRTLPQYAPFAWAVSVGNEQDLSQGDRAPSGRSVVCSSVSGRRSCRRSSAGEDYRAVWNAVEPVVARVAPRAIRVFGETSPFGFAFLEDGFHAGRPRGVQAIAFHCYDVNNGGLSIVSQVAAWAASKRLPLWCSEMSASSLRSPHPWLRQDSQPRWNALVAAAEARSPNLRMISYYRWPQIGAF
jgi:hypothetical protein